MSIRPEVSIIVRAFNEEEHLGRLLEGVYFQKLDFPIEVILVDSGSTDRTLEIASAFFGAQVLANDIRDISAEQARTHGVQMHPLETLLAESDFVTLHCDLNETSHHILNAERLALCRPNTVVINTARGPLIDESALVRALEESRIADAGLDVFEHEPLPLESPLRRMPQVLLAAHNSNSSPQCWQRVHRNSVAMLFEELGLG